MRPFTFVIFGITSNLAQKYSIPAFYDLIEKDLLPTGSQIVGIARYEKTPQEFKKYLSETLHQENLHHKHLIKKETFEKLAKITCYFNGDIKDSDFYQKLKSYLNELSPNNDRIFYLATYPDLYKHFFENLKKHHLTSFKKGSVKLMVEKPIGIDTLSYAKINKLMLKYFSDEQIYRIDHYLGKETIQNILTFRFGNGVFEPFMNNKYIDHIQITAAEDFGIKKRGAYYDSVGALKDVGQNHLLQMLAFATMDAPKKFIEKEVKSARIKLLSNLIPDPKKVIFGQYQGYLKEENVVANSKTDTFFAFKTKINNPRFKNIPIYIRGGKQLQNTVTEIVIIFKFPINRLFKDLNPNNESNILIYRIQPNEGVYLKIVSKKPGHGYQLETNIMQFKYQQDPINHYLTDPYERLIMDVAKGEKMFFNDQKETLAEWKFIDKLTKRKVTPFVYKSNSWGPKESDKLIEKDGRSWINSSANIDRL